MKLKKLEILNIESNTHYSIIYIINWPIYQAAIEGRNSESDRQGTAKEHKQEQENVKNKRTPEEVLSEISELGRRYPDQEIINQTFQAISSTRKSKRIADNVKLSILQAWEKYPVESVMAGIKAYLDKGYNDQGKDEMYLLGIIRNVKPEDTRTGGQVRKSTGSPLLDEYYRNQGERII
ncbi:MAG: hypothetical protein WC405_07120 [Syntrophales bacterium]